MKFAPKTVQEPVKHEPLYELPKLENESNFVESWDHSDQSPQEKKEINATYLNNMNKSEREHLYASLADLRAKLKEIDEQEAKILPNKVTDSRNRRDDSAKTITRTLKPKSAKSMSIDKWIEVIF